MDRPSPLSSDYVLDFQTTDFEAESKLALKMLSDMAAACFPDRNEKSKEAMFGLAKLEYLAGWHFSKLYLSSGFVMRLHERNLQEFEKIDPNKKPKAKGKVYIGDQFVTMLAMWLNAKMRQVGCSAEVKIGPEMADLARGTPGSAVGAHRF